MIHNDEDSLFDSEEEKDIMATTKHITKVAQNSSDDDSLFDSEEEKEITMISKKPKNEMKNIPKKI